MPKTLAIGSGKQAPRDDLTRLDISPLTDPDVVWDLREFPYPFEDGSFTEIQCYDVIEHLDDIPAVLSECHRLLQPKGLLKITTPHFSCSNSYVDPTHRFHLSYFSFDYFDGDHKFSYYSRARFVIKRRQIQFDGTRAYRAVMRRFANRFPALYERRLCWIFPAWFLYFELQAIG